jgi:hypothetical protein
VATAEAPTLATKGFGRTSRLDSWITPVALQFAGFTAAIAYSTWAAFQGSHYLHEPYLSPFYSPTIILSLNFWPFNTDLLRWLFVPISPALIILIFPLGFRLTCYYYRKMYYRTYFAEPPACAVGELGKTEVYSGETRFPFILLNFHRYFLYAAMAILVILAYDAVLAFFHHGWIGVGLGTVILVANLVTLALYTFSCHSLRHLVGGKVDCFSCVRFGAGRHKAWVWITKLNKHHMLFAWVSLAGVCLADFYVRLLAGGIPGMTFEDPLWLIAPAPVVAWTWPLIVAVVGVLAAAGLVAWFGVRPWMARRKARGGASGPAEG